MQPRGVNRVVIAVRDFDAALKLYGDLLGGEFVDVSADAAAYGMRCAINFDAGIEICSPLPGANSYTERWLNEHGDGMMSVVFCVDNVDEARENAARMGIPAIGMIADYDQAHLDAHMEGRFKKYKEFMLNSAKRCGFTIVLAQIDPK